MQNNLIQQMIQKFKANKADFGKKLASLALAGSFAASGLALGACSNTNNTNSSPSTSTNQPGGSDVNPGGSTNPNYSKFSEVLQNVLTERHYSALIGNANSYNMDYAYNNPKYQPIPYGFLEDEGFDIDKFKNKQLSCTAELFSIDNDLYVELKAEIPASTNYIANYVLKYSLTEQEMKELNKLFAEISISSYQVATYFQAPFFVQELSYLKTPEVMSIGYTTAACNDSVVEFFNARKMISTSHLATYLKSEDKENTPTVFHYYIVRPKTSSSKFNSKMGIVKMHVDGHCEMVIDNRLIQTNTNMKSSGKLLAENRENFNNSIQPVISYTSRNHYFKDLNNKNALENVFGK